MNPYNIFNGEPFTIASAVASGADEKEVRKLIRTYHVRQVFNGVYVAIAARDSVELRAKAAALVLPEHAVVCDLSAAWVHGIDLFKYAERDVVPDLDVVSADGHTRSRRRGVFGGKRALNSDDVVVVSGVRVTSPARTACDIARLYGRWRAIAALDAFRREFGISKGELTSVADRLARQRGVVQLRELIAFSSPDADSQPESWIRLIVHDAGLPTPAAQVRVVLPDGREVRMENAYEHLKIAVEYDGEEFHDSEAAREHDRLRRQALQDAGWLVIVLRKDCFGKTQRDVWLRELADAIADRAPERPTKRVYSRDPHRPVRLRHRARR